MNISGVSSSYMQQMSYGSVSGMQKPSKEDVFSKVDSSGDGSVDMSELSSLADEISSKTGEAITVDADSFSSYDSDGDGSLNGDELKSFMDDNRPEDAQGMGGMQGPPPGGGKGGPPPSGGMGQMMGDTEDDATSQLLDILEESETSSTENYLALLESLQEEYYASEDEEEEEESDYIQTTQDYLDNINQALSQTTEYTSISIEA